jgi:hypothetical protein
MRKSKSTKGATIPPAIVLEEKLWMRKTVHVKEATTPLAIVPEEKV